MDAFRTLGSGPFKWPTGSYIRVAKGRTNELKRVINLTRVPIGEKESVRWVDNLVDTTAALGEPNRCVHIGDRQADIYELFCAANDVGTHFLVRTSASRLAKDASTKTDAVMEEADVKCVHRIEVRDRDGQVSETVSEIKYQRMVVRAPIAKAKDYGPLTLTVIHAKEKGTPKNRGKDRLEASHRPARAFPLEGDRKTEVVGASLENRALPQNLEIGLQG